jgi:Chain length determinant protein
MQSNNHQETSLIDFAPYIRAVWKHKWLIAILVLVSVVITVALHWREKPSYMAIAHIKVGKVWDLPVGDPNVISELITKPPFLLRLNEKLSKKRNIEALSRAVTAEKLEAGKGRARYVYLVRLTGKGASPELAQELVKTTAEQAIEESNRVYDEAYQVYEKREKDLQTKIEELKTKNSANLVPTELYEKRLELQLLEQELGEAQINNQSPLKTFRTALAEEIEPAKEIPTSNIYKLLVMATATVLAIGVLIALALEFGWPIVKEATRRE